MKFFRLLDLIFSSSPEYIGQVGEDKISRKLKWVNFMGKEGIILRNVYIPKNNKYKTEVDLLYITQKGIFVIESKNYTGWVFGSENNTKWTTCVYKGKDWLGRKRTEKHQFYNPIWQNNSHIRALKNYLKTNIPMFSLIVFSDRCSFKEINLNTSDVYICHQAELPGVMRSLWRNHPDVLSEKEIETIYEKLAPLTNLTDEEKNLHIQQIYESINQTDKCPLCGGKLVLRTARQGQNAGNQFYGCSNYPKCRFTKNL